MVAFMTNLPMQKCDGKSDTVINSTIVFSPGREYACTPICMYVYIVCIKWIIEKLPS